MGSDTHLKESISDTDCVTQGGAGNPSTLRLNVIANYAGKAWAALINIAFVPLYIRYMGIEAYGLVGMFVTLQPLMTILDLGLSPSINRELARYSAVPNQGRQMRDLVRTLEVVYWGIASVMCLLVLLFSPVFATNWLHTQNLPIETVCRAVLLLGLSIVFQWPVGFYTGGLMGLQKQVLFNSVNSVVWTLRGVGALLVVMYSSSPVLAFFWWQLLMSFVNVAAMAFALWRSLPPAQASARFRVDMLRSVWRLAVGMSAVSVIILLFNQMDKIILSKQISLTDFAYYSLAWQVVGCLFMLYYPIYAAFFPVLTQLHAQNDTVSLRLAYHKGCQVMSVAVFPVSITLALFSKDILSLWVRDPVTVDNCHLIMAVLLAGATFNGILYMPYSLLQAYGRMRSILYVFVPSLLLYAPLLFFTARQYGVLGAAICFSVMSIGQVLIAIVVIHSRFAPGEQLNWLKNDLLCPLAASLVVGLACKSLVVWPMAGLLGCATVVASLVLTLVATALATPVPRRVLARYRF
jgi:O-antigen/teichoic acid export membrane protein